MVFSTWRCEPANLLDHFCQVAKHVEAVSRRPRFWSTFFGSTGKFSPAVATDEEDSWVLFEPRFQGGGLPIRNYEGYPLVALKNFSGIERKTLIIVS
jgi:hypothetical protein